MAYTGHFCPSTGTDKSAKLGYFLSTGTENNIFLGKMWACRCADLRILAQVWVKIMDLD